MSNGTIDQTAAANNLGSMAAGNIAEILLEILRVGLIAIRNLSLISHQRPEYGQMLNLWAELCHTLPPVLLGGVDERAVGHFTQGDLKRFCADYPAKSAADFQQIVSLEEELKAALASTDSN